MAEFTHRYSLNVPGKYYVTNQCTDSSPKPSVIFCAGAKKKLEMPVFTG